MEELKCSTLGIFDKCNTASYERRLGHPAPTPEWLNDLLDPGQPGWMMSFAKD